MKRRSNKGNIVACHLRPHLPKDTTYKTQGWGLFLIWIKCNPSMAMLSKTRQSEGWDCLSFPKFQWLHCWSFGMDTQFFPRFANAVITYPWWDDCWSMLIKGTSDQQALSFKEWFGVDQNIWIKFLWILVDDILGFLKRMKTMGTQWHVVFNCELYQYGAVDTMDCNFECRMEEISLDYIAPRNFEWYVASVILRYRNWPRCVSVRRGRPVHAIARMKN